MTKQQNCTWCSTILGIENEEHGYGLSDQQAEDLIRMGRETADLFEATVHEDAKARRDTALLTHPVSDRAMASRLALFQTLHSGVSYEGLISESYAGSIGGGDTK